MNLVKFNLEFINLFHWLIARLVAGDDSQDEEDEDLSFVDDIINNYSNNPKTFSCSFCAFTVDKKQTLRVHLEENHSSQASAPVLLANDSVLAQPNTKY